MAEDYKISLGIDLDTSDLQTQINTASNNIKPIDIKVDAETKELTRTINEALKSLSNGSKNALTLDTSKLEGSFKDVASVIKDIKVSIGSLDSNSGMKSLLSSINQISTALEKASNKFEELTADLKSLNGKDFNVNLGLNLGGSNPTARNSAYSSKVQNETLPQLKQQAKALQDYFKEYYKVKDEISAIMKLAPNRGGDILDLYNPMSGWKSKNEKESWSNQINAYKQYINIIKEAASLRGIDISHITSSFSKSADQLVQDAVDVQTGTKEMENSFEKLKQVFGGSGGIDITGLSGQLEPIIVDLGEIRKALEGLSKGVSIDGLTQSFDRLSDTIEKLVSNVTLAKNALGDELGNAIPSSLVKQSINIDDVIDEQVLKLMNEYAITGTKAFDEIRQSLVDFKNGSGDIDKITSAISNNMKVVNEAKNDYKDLAEYIKMFNASGAKVHIPDSIKQEYGDDYKSMRSQLGRGFTSGQGMDFETFVEETNEILGQTIDLSHGAEAAFGDLVNKVNSTKGGKFLTGDDLFKNGILDMGDVVANVSTSLEKIENAEEEIARTSTSAANTVIQNEERKQQAYRETKQLISNSAKEAISNVSSKSIDESFRIDEASSAKFKREMENLVSQWTNAKGELTDIKIDTTTVYDKDTERNIEKLRQAQVTYNNELGETIKKTIAWRQIGSEVNTVDGKEVVTPIHGFVEVAGQYSKTLGKTKVQTDTFVKQQKQAVSNLTNQINQLNRAANDQNASRPIKDSTHLDTLSSKYNEVISAIQRMKSASTDTFVDEQNNVKKLISEYKSLVSEYKNAENVSTKMKGTDFASGLDIAKNDLKKFKAEAKDFPQITKTIKDLDSAINEVGDTSSLNKFNDQLRVARSELAKIKSETSATNRNEKVGINVSGLESKIADLQRISPEIDKFEAEINGAKVSVQSLLGDLKQVKTQGDFSVVNSKWKAFADAAKSAGIAVTETVAKVDSIKDIKYKLADTGFDGFEQEIKRIKTEAERFVGSSTELREALNRLDAAFDSINAADEANDIKKLASANEEYENALKQVYSQLKLNQQIERDNNKAKALQQEKAILNNQMETWLRENTRAAKDYGDEIRKLQASLNNLDASGVKEVRRQFSAFKSDAKVFEKTGLTVFDNLKKKIKEYSTYFSAAELFMYAEEALRSMFEQVKLIDTAMTELKKVTDETDESYSRFLTNAASRAKEIGTTIDGLVESTAAFARLGYGFKDAQGLAEVANIYAVVGDEVEGVEGATESLISTMAAFKDEMNGLSDSDFAMSIVDKMNEVANRYSITSGGLGEALQRSASSMAAANNTLDETIALTTAANEVVQNPEKVGNALKTVSMRIRSAKTEMEEAGIETEGMVESTAKLRSEIMALSGVDIMASATEFKSTYAILDELSEKWEDLSDISQATIIELMAGKHQGNVFASLMQNFDVARNSLETSLNSAGSAMKEHERWSQSLEAQILKLKASWQSLSQAFLSSDFLKSALNGIIALVDGITKLIDTLGTIPTLLGAFAGFKGLANLPKFLSRLSSLTSRTGGIITFQNVISALGRTFPGATKGVKLFTAALKGLFAAAMAHPVIAGLALVIGGLAAAFTIQKKNAEELAEEVGELTSKYREQYEETKKLKNDFDTSNESSMISKYEKLSKGVGKFGENISLTADEYSEYQNIVSTIAEQFPSLVTGYDEQGNAILSCKNNVEELTTAYENLIHAQNQEILSSNAADIEKNFENILSQANGYDFWERIGNGASFDGIFGGTLDDYDMKTNTAEWLKDLISNKSNVSQTDIKKYLKENQYSTMEIVQSLQNAGYDVNRYSSFSKISKVLSDILKNEPEKLQNILDTYYTQFDEAVEEYKTKANALLSEAFDVSSAISGLEYDNIGEELQNIAYQTVNSLDFDFLSKLKENGKTIDQWTKELLNQLNSISKKNNAQIEAAFDLQTQFNGGKISYGEYVSGLQDVQSTIDKLNLKNEAKEQLKISLDLDEGGIVDQYDALVKRLSDSKNYDFKISEDEAKRFLDGLTAEEYAVAVDVITKLDSNGVYETIDEIKNVVNRELMLQGLTFDLNLEVETAGIEALNTALAESVTGSGLSSDSIDALRGRYAELEARGYDLSSMFETTSHGIHLNREEFNKLEKELSNQKLTEVNGQLEEMQRAYDQLGEDIRNCTDPVEKAKLFSDRQLLAQRISEAAELASQYEGLTSAYNDWLAAEESGQERDMYEKIIEGFENIDDEISRGWYDDATIEFLELLSGKDLTGASITELKKTYKDLGKEVKNTGYTVRDFFTVNEDGDSTNTGVYNFLRAVETLEKDKAFKNLENIQNLVQRKDGKIVGFDFQVVGGDEAIAEALGISEELVQIILRAADDAGFVVSLDGTYKQFAVLESEAKAAVQTLRELSEEETELGKKLKEAGGDFEFDFNTSNIKTLEDDLKQAQNILDTFKDKKTGEIDINANGATEAMQLVSTLQARLDDLKSEQYGIGLTVEDEKFEEPLEKLQEYGRNIATLNQLKINPTVNSDEIKEYETNLQKISEYFANLDGDFKVDLGFEADDNWQEVQKKIESGEVKIPTVLDIQANMDKTLTDLKNIALLGSGLLNEDQEEKIRLQILADIDVKADEVDDSDVKETVKNTVENSNNTVSNENTTTVTTDANVEVGEVKTEGFWGKVKSWWNNLWSDDEKPETAEVETDVNVEAGEIDASKIKEDVNQTIEELELTVDEYKDLIQNIEDKDVTLTVKVEGLDDVRELNKNIDLATNIEGDIDNLSEFVKGAKTLSELDDNISTFVTAEVKGNVIDEFEYKLNNLKVFSDSAKDLDDIGFINSEVTANVKGNVIDEFEYKINNLKVFSDSAKDLGDIGNVESSVKATINSGSDGDVIDEFEYKLNNLGEFAEHVKKLQGLGDVDISVKATINSGEDGDVIDEFEYKLDNLSEFANHVRDLQGLQSVDISVNAAVNTGEDGDVVDTFEYKLNNLSKFADYVKELQGLNNVDVSVNATVNTGNDGDVVDTFEYKLNNLEVFAQGAKALQGVGNVSSEITAKVNTGESGDAIDTFEYKLNNLNTFAEGAKALQGVGNVSSTVTAEINSGDDGDVIDEFEYKLDNLEKFAEGAKALQGIGSVDVSVSAKVNTGESGDVIDTFEYKLDNLDEFANYAKELQGLENVDISIKANVNTGESGDVVDTFEYKLDNLGDFADYAKSLQGLESVDITITANAKGNVVGEKTEGKINNLEVFAKGAKGLSNIESKEITITANAKGNVVGKKTEGKINNLEVFAQGAKKIQGLESKSVTITAEAKGNVVGKKTEGKINNLEVFAKGAKALNGIGTKTVTITAEAKGNVVGKKTEGKINNLKVFGDSAKALNGVSSKTVEITANANGNAVSGDGVSSRLSSLTEFKSLISGMSSQTVTVSVTANVDSDKINSAIDLLTKVANSGVFKDYNATVKVGATIDKVDDTNVKNYKAPAKKGTVSYSVDENSKVYSWTAPSKKGTVNYSAEVEALTNAQKHKTGTITYSAKIKGFPVVNGTANVNGSAFANGTTGKAYRHGDWGVKKTETALTGELGQELVVYKNRYWTVGDNGAEFATIPKGAIVFNHKQTAELFANGKVTSDGGRGKVFANGTAFVEGTAYSSGKNGGADEVGGNSVGSSDTENKFEETIDWIETILDRAERAIDKYERQADNVYKSWSSRNKALEKEIDEVGKTISLYEQAKNKYLSEANSVGLSESYKKKVREGSLSVEDFAGESDEKLVEKIKEYQDLYEKYLDCQDAIDELKEKEYELYTQKFDNIVTKYEGVIDDIEHQKNMIEEYMSQYEGNVLSDYVAHDAKSYQQIANYYQQLIRKEQLSIVELEKEKVELLAALDEAVANGLSKNSEKYNELMSQINDLDLQIAQSNTNIIENNNNIAQSFVDGFDNIAQNYDNMLSIIEHKKNMIEEGIAQSEAQGWLVSGKYYEALIGNEQQSIAKLQEEKAALLSQLEKSMAEGGIEKYSNSWYEMVNAIDDVTLAIEQGETALLEYAQAIEQLEWEKFDLIQDRISAITEEADFLIELMSNKKLYDDNGQLTNEGKSTMGLHGLNYNTYMHQADITAAEIARLKAQMAADPYDTELEEHYREMVSLQQQYILQAEDEKNAIRDMVEEGIELEISALEEKIDLYKDGLSSAKDLYEYNKKVQEQTKEIASIEKQIAAYQGDDSEESKKTVQELKVALEEAESDLEETEFDKYIDNISALLDSLALEYETVLNERLDNIDYLIESMIAEINANASLIDSTITQASTDVGYTVSESMRDIWTEENNAIASYTDKLAFNQTNTYNVVNGIKTSVDSMVSKLDSIAAQKIAEANKSSTADSKQANAKPKTSTTTNKTTTTTTKPATKPTTTQNKSDTSTSKAGTGDGKPAIGDKVKFISGQYYYSSQGVKPVGSKYQGKEVYITNINTRSWATHPYHISTGKTLGSGDLGWLKLNQISGYATGKKKILDNELAWTQEEGQEYIVRPSDGAILTPVAKGDSVLTSAATNNIWSMANSPADFIRNNLSLGSTNVPNNSTVQNSYTQNLDKVVFSFPNVKNYDEMLAAMQKDPNFDRLIESMSIGKLTGKSSLAKGKAIR